MLKLRELRKKSGITMKELGSKLGVVESTISQYETGKRQPDYEMLLKLSEFFGVSVDYMLREEKNAPAEETRREILDDDLMFGLWGDSDDVNEDDLADVKRYAEFIRERKKGIKGNDGDR